MELRAKRAEQKMKESGAADMLLAALSEEGELTQRARRFVTDFIGTGELLRQKIMEEDDVKTSGRVQSLNNLGFAFANIGRFIESMSSMSLSGKLGKAQKNGSEQGQPWEKGMLQQINVTVQNLQSQAKAAEKIQASDTLPVENLD